MLIPRSNDWVGLSLTILYRFFDPNYDFVMYAIYIHFKSRVRDEGVGGAAIAQWIRLRLPS